MVINNVGAASAAKGVSRERCQPRKVSAAKGVSREQGRGRLLAKLTRIIHKNNYS
jgi:hypothetical protein